MELFSIRIQRTFQLVSTVLLRQGEFTVSEVSYKVGFEDPFYFSKCFKAHFDCTPKNYKKSI